MAEITNEDYTFVERNDQENWVVRLKTGPYKDTFYCYDRVQLKVPEGADLDNDEDVDVGLSFRYGLIESPLKLEELAEDVEFNEYIGDVLRHIIEDSFDKGKYRIGEEDRMGKENGKAD